MSERLPTFEIECGPYRGKEDARGPLTAIVYFWRGRGRDRKEAGRLLRYRELPWNGQFKWDKKSDGRARRGKWYYVETTQ